MIKTHTPTIEASNWLNDVALPFWATRGFDAASGLFEEQLDFHGEPIISAPRRVMVQARQISVFAAASFTNRYAPGIHVAKSAAEKMLQYYSEADSASGWIFSIDRSGNIVSSVRDLYAHAFVIFALAWLQRVAPSHKYGLHIDKTLALLDTAFHDLDNGGYWDCLPRQDQLRRQNPHMHLFEALIELYITRPNADILLRCSNLCKFAKDYLIDETNGNIVELYTDDWNVYPAPGRGSVEPGHLFEWAWLLRRYQTISGEDQTAVVQSLLNKAVLRGLNVASGRIVDGITEDGEIQLSTSRCWPHAEALKALTMERALGNDNFNHLIDPVILRLLRHFCLDELQGGWIDQLDEHDQRKSKFMPASTLYHLYFGLSSVAD